MRLDGDKWVVVYPHPTTGATCERLVTAGVSRLRFAVNVSGDIGTVSYKWDGHTRDAHGRRVYA